MVFCLLKTHRDPPPGGFEGSYVGLGILSGEFLSIALTTYFP